MFNHDPLANPAPLVRRVYAYVAYRMSDGADAEDVTSEVFERALRYRNGYDSAKGSPTAWLIGIARRVVDSALVANTRPTGDLVETPSDEDIEGDALRRITLSSALSELGDRDRELIALRYGADLSARRIGELLDLRPNAVEVAVHRALGRLRAAMESDGSGPEPAGAPLGPSVALRR